MKLSSWGDYIPPFGVLVCLFAKHAVTFESVYGRTRSDDAFIWLRIGHVIDDNFPSRIDSSKLRGLNIGNRRWYRREYRSTCPSVGFLLVRANKQGFFSISQTVRRSSKNLPKLLRKTKSLLIKSELGNSAFWLFCGSASRMLIYTLCTALATQIGVIPAASNNTLLDIYFFVCYLIEPLFTLSTILLPKKVKTNKIEAWWMIRILFYLAIFAAITLSCATSISISSPGHLNLIEPELLKSVTSVKPYVVASVGASSFALALDGIRVGMGGAKNVGQAQVFNLLLTVALAAWMKLYAP